MEYQKKSYHMEAVCGSAHYQIAAYWSRVLNKPAIKAYQASRRGIVLTANYTAKQKGVKTGQALWQAKSACPDLVVVPPRMELYLQFSSMLREIYGEYTDLVEPYGCDEAWLDVTGSTALKGDEKKIADEIRSRVKKELGITVSIGISWNKIFAKLGSDYKKPDAITQFHKENYQSIVWNLPAANLLYVGRSTRTMLNRYGIKIIGKIATSDPDFLERLFGKMGLVLYSFANGWDDSPVAPEGYAAPIKSIGNSTTTPRDLETNLDTKIIFMALAESVSARLRKYGFKCNVVSISIRDNGLYSFTRQQKLKQPTDITNEIFNAAYQMFLKNYDWRHPIRSLGVRTEELVLGDVPVQLDLFASVEQREKQEKMDQAVDEIRRRFGYFSIQKAFVYQDKALASLDAQSSHTVHPVGYFNGR